MKQYLLIMATAQIIAQENTLRVRQVVIGGQIGSSSHLTASTPLKSAIKPSTSQPKGYFALFRESLYSSDDPFCSDVCLAFGPCPCFVLMTSLSFPETHLACICTANCLVFSCLLCSFTSNYAEEDIAGQLMAKCKKDIYSLFRLSKEKRE